jgi:hypothetical protein
MLAGPRAQCTFAAGASAAGVAIVGGPEAKELSGPGRMARSVKKSARATRGISSHGQTAGSRSLVVWELPASLARPATAFSASKAP